jgi:hypothetical protein
MYDVKNTFLPRGLQFANTYNAHALQKRASETDPVTHSPIHPITQFH